MNKNYKNRQKRHKFVVVMNVKSNELQSMLESYKQEIRCKISDAENRVSITMAKLMRSSFKKCFTSNQTAF